MELSNDILEYSQSFKNLFRLLFLEPRPPRPPRLNLPPLPDPPPRPVPNSLMCRGLPFPHLDAGCLRLTSCPKLFKAALHAMVRGALFNCTSTALLVGARKSALVFLSEILNF